MRKAPPRLLGLLLIGASCGTTWLHRSIWEAARYGPAHPAELALGLASFMLASVGVLLLIHGGSLFDHAIAAPTERGPPPQDPLERLLDPITPAGRPYDTRRGVAMLRARRAVTPIGTPARRPTTPARPPQR